MARNHNEEEDEIVLMGKRYSARQYIQIGLIIVSSLLGGANLSKQEDLRESVIRLEERVASYQKEISDIKMQLSFFEQRHAEEHNKLNERIDEINKRVLYK